MGIEPETTTTVGNTSIFTMLQGQTQLLMFGTSMLLCWITDIIGYCYNELDNMCKAFCSHFAIRTSILDGWNYHNFFLAPSSAQVEIEPKTAMKLGTQLQPLGYKDKHY